MTKMCQPQLPASDKTHYWSWWQKPAGSAVFYAQLLPNWSTILCRRNAIKQRCLFLIVLKIQKRCNFLIVLKKLLVKAVISNKVKSLLSVTALCCLKTHKSSLSIFTVNPDKLDLLKNFEKSGCLKKN